MSEERPRTNGPRRRATLTLPATPQIAAQPEELGVGELTQVAYGLIHRIEHLRPLEQMAAWRLGTAMMTEKINVWNRPPVVPPVQDE